MDSFWNFIDRIGPQVDEESNYSKLFKVRMFTFTLMFILLFTVIFSVISVLFSMQIQLEITFILIPECLILLYLNNKLNRTEEMITFFCSSFLLLVTYFTIEAGAFVNSTILWFSIVPVLVTFIGGKAWGAFVGLLTVGCILFIDYKLAANGFILREGLSFDNYRKINNTNLTALTLFIYIFISVVLMNYKKVEESLMRVKTSILDQSKAYLITKLSAGISHEINNPLTAVRFANEIIKMSIKKRENIDFDRLEKMCEKIDNNIDRASEVIGALKDLSTEDQDLKFEYVEISQIINEVQSILGRDLLRNNIALKVTNDIFLDEKLFCNKNKIVEALVLLINNSIFEIKKVNAKQQIDLNLYRQKNDLLFDVVDWGNGVDKHNEDKIFDPFFTLNDIDEGMGLGLTIASYIAKKHSGEVSYFRNKDTTHFRLKIAVV